MKFGRYIKEHIAWLVMALFLIITIDIFLMTLRGSIYLALYVSFAIIICYLLGVYLDYRRLRNIFNEIQQKQEAMEKKYLVPEVLEGSESQEGEIIIDILRQSEMAMTDNVADYRRNIEYYKDYIETWVHEIKIPISTSKMILENHKDKPLKVSGIDAEIDRIEGYVEQALYYSKSTEVEKDYFIKEIDIRDIVKQAVAKRKKSFIAMKASIDIHDMELEKSLKSDGKWLSFIIGQILDNSIKYAREDEPLKLTIYLDNNCENNKKSSEERNKEDSAEDSDKELVDRTKSDHFSTQQVNLVIEDNGVGIKSAEVGRVFDKGFTGTNGRSGKASTGIGLYLCRKLCQRLEHDIRVESVEGQGTRVIIMF